MIIKIELSLKESYTGPRLDIARWIVSFTNPDTCRKYNNIEVMSITKNLVAGSTWSPYYALVRDPNTWPPTFNNISQNKFCDVKVSQELTEQEKQEERYKKEQQFHRDLLKLAVDGDVIAALNYCRLEFEGKIRHNIAYAH